MKYNLVKTPKLIHSVFPNYIWKVNTDQKELYLTFDDGPTPEITPWVLKTLKDHNAKATFFCIGKNIEKHPRIFQQILSEGHAIGNHSNSHLKGWKTNTKDYLKDIELAEIQIGNHTKTSTMFRPPYGQLKYKQGWKLRKRGYHVIMWDVLSFDWQKDLSQEACLNNVVSKSKSGSIIVFHDSKKANKNMAYALPRVLEHFAKLDYNFKALEL